ncbi:penicillin-binding transpeptidase domain-containing protein [Rhabdochlamydiaceae symbiont of Dictyostelium giganteum]|uniref:penicillin-binding transpeptidase domain-containing protein n=1 Tax=Rhabdochlamydiaceae symbiont of Dictyostelium giganteum TaxID=3342349 RepID=UPI00384C2B6A
MDLSLKINRILQFFALCLILILARSWHLAVIQHDKHVKISQQPRRRTTLEKPDRATIQDRFGIPLAINKIQYNAAIYYSHIRQIPTLRWKKREDGVRVKVFERSEYITKLSSLLSAELGIPAHKIEDLIHGRASLLPHTPFIIKESLSESEYYRLKALEKDWIGLEAQRSSHRDYPLGKVGGHVIGYLGKIDSQKYLKLAHELRSLEDYLIAKQEGEIQFLPEGFDSLEQVAKRYFELQEKAYSLNDLVGKSGIESYYDTALRGYAGKQIYAIDRHGNVLHELPGSYPATSGKKVTLTLSAELQDYAEKLLAANEGPHLDPADPFVSHRWIKGSALIALDPKTGEVMAFASYPRFDPNDFIPSNNSKLKQQKTFHIQEWLESEEYLGEIWDGKRSLRREYFSFVKGKYIEEFTPLSLERYLEAIFSQDTLMKDTLHLIGNLEMALEVQKSGTSHPLLQGILKEQDKLLILDLCHLLAPHELFSEELISSLGDMSLSHYFSSRQEAMRLLDFIKPRIRELFYDYDFTFWKEAYFKSYLKEMRHQEKQEKRYAKPYTDYLDQIEKKLWLRFWETYRSIFLYTALTGQSPVTAEDYPHLTPYLCLLKEDIHTLITPKTHFLKETLEPLSSFLGANYLSTFKSFDELESPLKRRYPKLHSPLHKPLEKHLASAFYPPHGYGFTKAYTHQIAAPPGSVFKLVTGYEALLEQYQKNLPLNPLTITDDWRGNVSSSSFIVGFLEDGTPLKRTYKGGRLPKSSHPGMGRLEIEDALEQSSNVYFSLLAGDVIEDPSSLIASAKLFGMGEKTGIDLPLESPGKIPDDIHHNKTGLYSFAIGQHTLETTPLQTAVMMQTIANQGCVMRPHLVKNLEGMNRVIYHELFSPSSQKGFEILSTSHITHEKEAFQEKTGSYFLRKVPFPSPVFNTLFTGMQRAVLGKRGSARPAIMRRKYDHPLLIKDYIDIHQDLIAKTGTAQVLYKTSLSSNISPIMEHYVSFGAIAYTPDSEDLPPLEKEPELVVVVMMRYRKAGLEGAPMAAQLVKKWREIKAHHASLQSSSEF